MIWASLTQPGQLRWLLPGLLPRDVITILEGRKATGKSSVAAAIVASMTGGPVIPGWTGPRVGRVIWCASEDDWASVVVPRLAAAGADLSRVASLFIRRSDMSERRMILPDDLEQLREFSAGVGAELLVLDPYISLCSPALDCRVEQQARLYLDPLTLLAAELRCSVLLTRHLRKGNSGDAREAGLGSVAVANAARAVLRCDEHPHEQERWILSSVACNHGRSAASQVYRLLDTVSGYPRIDWCGAIDLDAAAIAEGRGTEADRDEWHDADLVLAGVIGDGWVRVSEVQQRAEQAGITPRMLRRAKARLGIPSRQRLVGHDHYWEWGPPRRGWPFGIVLAEGAGGGTHAPGRLGQEAPPTPAPNERKKGTRPRRPRAPAPPPPDPSHTPSEDTNHDATTD